jgi:transposase-like protein
VSNLKAFVQGAYHGRVRKYLRLYAKEFEWRFNSLRPQAAGGTVGRFMSDCW